MSKLLSKISIKWRVCLYFVAFTLILLALLWVFQTMLLGTIYQRIKTESLKKCVNEITSAVKNEDYYDRVEAAAKAYDVSVKIVDADYETLYAYAVSPTNIVNRISKAELYILCQKAQENSGSYVQIYQQYLKESRRARQQQNDENEEEQTLPEGFPQGVPERPEGFTRGEPHTFIRMDVLLNLMSTRVVRLPDGTDGYLIVDSVITPVDATVHTLAILLLYISIFMILISVVVAFAMARRISKPIITTNEQAKRLAKGDYSTRFESGGYKEIVQLNETLDHAAKELSKADELRRELIANVSHDLRTPLTMIIGYSEVMRDLPGENTPENIQVVIDEATRLSSLVNDLLDISRLQSGTGKITKTEYDLTQSIRDIIARFEKLVENGGYRIAFENDGEVTVSADETRMSQVIYNLLINAINYTGEDKTVRVVQKKTPEGNVRVEFIDSGEGIAREELPYIWDRYYRVDKTHKRAQMGTGLGLSIVKTILETHGAVYGVDSTPGSGSTFWFELPVEGEE